MKYKKCPVCELNYIKGDQEMCDVCRQSSETKSAAVPDITHKGRNIFWVFQGKQYLEELTNGYIWAPLEDAAGNSPAHWTMLENVKVGDIIFHGVNQSIAAISIAKTTWFKSRVKDGVVAGRQVDCTPTIIKNTLSTKMYINDIIKTCENYKYQPFDKNGKGRLGYLFDLNDDLAGIFARELYRLNPSIISQIEGFDELLKL